MIVRPRKAVDLGATFSALDPLDTWHAGRRGSGPVVLTLGTGCMAAAARFRTIQVWAKDLPGRERAIMG
jgi:hypothetical protein